jgi:6-phosphogluconolactonase
MINRRTFSTLLAGSVAAPDLAWSQGANARMALYSGVGTELTRYDVDVGGAALAKRDAVKLPSSIQYAWPHPSRKFLYVSSSSGGPGQAGNRHHASAFRIDPETGTLTPHGTPITLRERPVHHSVDIAGRYLLVAYNEPSGVSVHRINADGTIGDEVKQPPGLDVGIYGHQIRATPSNQSVILITRGNNATATKPEDPGALKIFSFKDGVLSNMASVKPGTGLGFGPRHLDFHPTEPWVFVSIERQSQLYVYKLAPDGGLSPDPLFITNTLVDPSKRASTAGPIHVHPNGKFVYLTNRGGWTSSPPPNQEKFEGWPIFSQTNSTIATFSINPQTGEPTLLENADSHGAHPRTFSLDAGAQILVAGSLVPIALRAGETVSILPAGLSVFRIGADGKPVFAQKYDIDIGKATQWWTGMVALA